MNILHICPHMGGGIGTVIMGWMDKLDVSQKPLVAALDTVNKKAAQQLTKATIPWCEMMRAESLQESLMGAIKASDIVLVHYCDHPMLAELFSKPLPPCRLAFWVHKHFKISEKEVAYPDRCIGTSPIQHLPDYIWSTGGVDRFLDIKPKEHKGFNIGYVGTCDYKKLHPEFLLMCHKIALAIPEARFTIVGEDNISSNIRLPWVDSDHRLTFTGKVDDVAPYLAEMDVFGYPLRPDNYGTSEQVLGEAMAAGVVPVVMDNPCERRIVTNFFDGYIAGSPEMYVSLIESFYLKTAFGREVIAHNAKQRAAELYSLDTMIQQWDDVFESMMDKPKTERGVI